MNRNKMVKFFTSNLCIVQMHYFSIVHFFFLHSFRTYLRIFLKVEFFLLQANRSVVPNEKWRKKPLSIFNFKFAKSLLVSYHIHTSVKIPARWACPAVKTIR